MRAYLAVAYEDRFRAKEAGAHWDPTAKRWYAISRPEFHRLRRWWPNPLPPEIASWLADAILEHYYGPPKSDPRIVAKLARDATHKTIIAKSDKAKARADKKDRRKAKWDRWTQQLHTGKPVKTKARFAEPFSGSSTEIHSVTVKLPLLTQTE